MPVLGVNGVSIISHGSSYAKAIKNVSLAEDHLHDHFPKRPVMPGSLIIEGLAQTGGLLVCEHSQFAEKVILAKVKKATFHDVARPGDQLRYEAVIEQIADAGASTSGKVTRDGQAFAEIDLFFSHIDQNMKGLKFPDENFVFTEQFKSLLHAFPGSRLRMVEVLKHDILTVRDLYDLVGESPACRFILFIDDIAF